MSTFRVPILNVAAFPDTRLTTGNVIVEPENMNFGSNSRYRHLLVRFLDTSTKDALAGKFIVPVNYVGNAKIYVEWASTVADNSKNVVWTFDYNTAAVGDSYDPSADAESLTVTSANGSTARIRLEASMTATAANFAANKEVMFIVSRNGASGSDTLASNAYLFNLLFEYTDV